jgi:glutamate synthase domain-containing protein 1
MCKLIVGVNASENPEKLKELKRIVKLQRSDVFDEPHGIAAMCILKSGKTLVWRELRDYQKVFDKLMENIENSKFFILHTRTSTGGMGEKNIHLFERGGCYMAHNGTIQKYNSWNFQNTKLEDKANRCDTLQFLEDIEKPLSVENIEKLVNDKNMNGVAVMYDKTAKKAFLIAKRAAETIVDPDQEYSIFFSYTPDRTVKTKYYETIFGVKVECEEEEEELGHETRDTIIGVYELQF